jgi:hypothetical protein
MLFGVLFHVCGMTVVSRGAGSCPLAKIVGVLYEFVIYCYWRRTFFNHWTDAGFDR